MYATMLIAVPTGIKVFNWVATMFKGPLTFETPMLFAIGFLFLFTIGGFSGLMLAIVPADYPISRYLFCGGAFSLCVVQVHYLHYWLVFIIGCQNGPG